MRGKDQSGMARGYELGISIAGMPVALSLGNLDEATRRQIEDRYAAFAEDQNPRMPGVKIEIEPGPPFIPFRVGSSWEIRTSKRNGRIEFESHLEKGWINQTSGEGLLVMRPEGNPENFLRVLYAWLCLEDEGILLHASGVVREGRGFVFFGPSGSGKTTVSSLSLNYTVLSDDLVILKRKGKEVRVYGVPFRGELVEAPRANLSAELSGLYVLVKDSAHHLSPVPPFEAVARLTSCVPFVMTDSANSARVMEICGSIEARVPVQALHFLPDAGFWRVIDGN